MAKWTEPAPEPHVPHKPADFVVLLHFSHLPLSLLLLYIFAQLAHFRQRKTKGDCAHSKKKTAKRKSSTVDAPVQEESPVAKEDSGVLGGGDVCKVTSCSDTPGGAAAAQVNFLSIMFLYCAHFLVIVSVTYKRRSSVCFCLSNVGKEGFILVYKKGEYIFVVLLLMFYLCMIVRNFGLTEGSASTGACFGDGSFISMSSSGVAVCIIPSNRCFLWILKL